MRYAHLRWLLFLGLCLALTLTLSPSLVQAGGLNVTPSHGGSGTTFTFSGTGFASNERVAIWLNYPDGSIIGQGYAQADASGATGFTVTPDGSYPFGYYTQVAHGMNSGYEVVAGFNYDAPASSGGRGRHGSGSGGCGGGNFVAAGFSPGETAATWTTRPDGVSLALPNAVADSTGVVSFTFVPQTGWPTGPYIVVASGYLSKIQGINNFNWDGASLTGGGTCTSSNSSGTASAPSSGPAPAPIAVVPKSIVDPHGPAVYLNTTPNALYYFDCSWKWRPMGGTIYFAVLGFTPGETVSYLVQDLNTGETLTTGTVNADGAGNVGTSMYSLGWPLDHIHVWFTGNSSGASFCGHFDNQIPGH